MKKKEDTVVTGVRMPVSLRDYIQAEADKSCRTLSQQIIFMLKTAIDLGLLQEGKNISELTIIISGPQGSCKGILLSVIAETLKEAGMNVRCFADGDEITTSVSGKHPGISLLKGKYAVICREENS